MTNLKRRLTNTLLLHGYIRDKKLSSVSKDVDYYTKGSVDNNDYSIVIVRKQIRGTYERLTFTFNDHLLSTTISEKAIFVIQNVYSKHGNWIGLRYSGVSFDEKYDKIIYDLDFRCRITASEGMEDKE